MRTLGLTALIGALVSAGFAQDARPGLSGSALIDHHVKAKWAELGIKPAARASDAEFLRRAYLDIVGVIPSLEEAHEFLGDKSPGKRAQLVDALVKDPRYADHWADVWTGILVGFDSDRRNDQYRTGMTPALREAFLRNVPYDRFARETIAVTGGTDEKPVGNYVARIQRAAGRDFPLALAGKVTRAFMGVQIQCAQCHDHPFDKWTQEDFYGMASFFSETRSGARKDGNRNIMMIDNSNRASDLTIPDSKAGPIKAAFLDSGKGIESGKPRRETFAEYVTGKENLQFARMAVNRQWAHLFGAGIVNPPDDFNGRNKPSHPELLDALAKDFAGHGYDLHWLIKAIAGSEAYGLGSRSAAKSRDANAEKYVALARVRPLSPEQILRTVLVATGQKEARPAAPGRGNENNAGSNTAQFRFIFGNDEGKEMTEFNGTIPSALLMMNGQLVGRGSGTGKTGAVAEIMAGHPTPESRVKAVYLKVLSRPPTPSESARWVAHVEKASGAAGYEDCLWTLLQTSEFLFNH